MKIAVVGGLGVGVAHVLAAIQIPNISSIDIYDIDKKIIDFYRNKIIKNSWGIISDSIINPPGLIKCIIGENPLKGVLYDLTIISTPNNTHLDYLKKFLSQSKKILIEKPMVNLDQINELRNILKTVEYNKIYSGFEWLYHPNINNFSIYGNELKYNNEKVKSISMIHGYPPETEEHLSKFAIKDLGIHLLSLLNYKSFDNKCDMSTLTRLHRDINTSLCYFEDLDLALVVGYSEIYKDKECAIRIDTNTGEIYFINWIPFSMGDLFYRQMYSILYNNYINLSINQHIEILEKTKVWYDKHV